MFSFALLTELQPLAKPFGLPAEENLHTDILNVSVFVPGWAQLSLQASQDQFIGFSTPAMFYLVIFASNTEYVYYSDILM